MFLDASATASSSAVVAEVADTVLASHSNCTAHFISP